MRWGRRRRRLVKILCANLRNFFSSFSTSWTQGWKYACGRLLVYKDTYAGEGVLRVKSLAGLCVCEREEICNRFWLTDIRQVLLLRLNSMSLRFSFGSPLALLLPLFCRIYRPDWASLQATGQDKYPLFRQHTCPSSVCVVYVNPLLQYGFWRSGIVVGGGGGCFHTCVHIYVILLSGKAYGRERH